MSSLPSELVNEILLRLPVEPLIRFQCVSKLWHALINHTDFIQRHLELSIAVNRERTLIFKECDVDPPLNCFWARFNDEQIDRALTKIRQPLRNEKLYTQILDYCNGLVCLHDYERGIAIWNPLIRRYKKLPFEPIENPTGFTDCRSGSPDLAFGYDPVNDDYKVMRVVQFYRKIEKIEATNAFAFELKVYSLRAHSWKRVEEEWPKELSPRSSSASLNGAFHWLVGPPTPARSSETLLAFDLATEKFREYTIPVQSDDDSVLGLEVLKGCLCICVNVFVTRNDVWVMKEYGVISSWARLYTIEQGAVPWTFEYCKPLAYSKDGKKVLMEQDFAYLFWYDIEEKRGTRVRFRPMLKSFQTATCVGSLVLLDGDILIDPRQKKRNKRKRKSNPAEGLNLLVEAMEEVVNEEQAV
ncbi:F-box protein CPR1-like isoform X1 [Corylus avellana]|uniref:F-box protein CPR1-like isoform X1 n=1 Tax=Corylus avellana TaxID=13451 RepID=UPI00286C03DA|nr:F-box protein CPR1-like isoform X1 [Corylus avellana]